MGELSVNYVKSKKRQDREQRDKLPAGERKALIKIRREARQHGAVLTDGGKGGLPPSLVLGVFRRDKWKCKIHGDRGEDDYGGLQVHHKGGIVESKWLSKKGHSNDPNNIVTLCAQAHDEIHNKARDEGVDSSQVEPEGDKE